MSAAFTHFDRLVDHTNFRPDLEPYVRKVVVERGRLRPRAELEGLVHEPPHLFCLISGVGPGTGSALARRFTEGGYRVALLARSEARLAALEDAKVAGISM